MLQHLRKGCAAFGGLFSPLWALLTQTQPLLLPAFWQGCRIPPCQDVPQSSLSLEACFGFHKGEAGKAKGVKLLPSVGWEILIRLTAVLPYLSGALRRFANKQAYKVRFIALDFLLGNWSPFNLCHALWTLCQWSWPEGCVYIHIYIFLYVCGLHLVLLFQAAPGSGTI